MKELGTFLSMPADQVRIGDWIGSRGMGLVLQEPAGPICSIEILPDDSRRFRIEAYPDAVAPHNTWTFGKTNNVGIWRPASVSVDDMLSDLLRIRADLS